MTIFFQKKIQCRKKSFEVEHRQKETQQINLSQLLCHPKNSNQVLSLSLSLFKKAFLHIEKKTLHGA